MADDVAVRLRDEYLRVLGLDGLEELLPPAPAVDRRLGEDVAPLGGDRLEHLQDAVGVVGFASLTLTAWSGDSRRS
jgi:hypothetical protein